MRLGAHTSCCYFHYMPVGNDAAPELLPTPEQRKYMYRPASVTCAVKPAIARSSPWTSRTTASLWAAASPAAGSYFHINANGDADPCVFIHYSDANIRDKHAAGDADSLRCSWPTTTASPSTRTTCAPAPCWKTPSLLRKMVNETGAHSHRPPEPGKRRSSVRQVQVLRRQLAADRRRDLVPLPIRIRESRYENYKDWKPNQQ